MTSEINYIYSWKPLTQPTSLSSETNWNKYKGYERVREREKGALCKEAHTDTTLANLQALLSSTKGTIDCNQTLRQCMRRIKSARPRERDAIRQVYRTTGTKKKEQLNINTALSLLRENRK